MNPHRISSKDEFEEDLKSKGFEKTAETTETGTFWRSTQTDKHILVPHPYQGMYPKFILKDFEEQLERMGQKPFH